MGRNTPSQKWDPGRVHGHTNIETRSTNSSIDGRSVYAAYCAEVQEALWMLAFKQLSFVSIGPIFSLHLGSAIKAVFWTTSKSMELETRYPGSVTRQVWEAVSLWHRLGSSHLHFRFNLSSFITLFHSLRAQTISQGATLKFLTLCCLTYCLQPPLKCTACCRVPGITLPSDRLVVTSSQLMMSTYLLPITGLYLDMQFNLIARYFTIALQVRMKGIVDWWTSIALMLSIMLNLSMSSILPGGPWGYVKARGDMVV